VFAECGYLYIYIYTGCPWSRIAVAHSPPAPVLPALSHPFPSYPSVPVPSRPVRSHAIPSYPVAYYPIPSHSVLPYPDLSKRLLKFQRSEPSRPGPSHPVPSLPSRPIPFGPITSRATPCRPSVSCRILPHPVISRCTSSRSVEPIDEEVSESVGGSTASQPEIDSIRVCKHARIGMQRCAKRSMQEGKMFRRCTCLQ
jgi:hypothetical protein